MSEGKLETNVIMGILKEKVQFAKDCRYMILRQLDSTIPEDIEIESRIQQDKKSEFFINEYAFKENFYATQGTNPIGKTLSDDKDEVLRYLDNAFPFCFSIDLRTDPIMWGNNSLGIDLAFYAMSLGASEEQLRGIKPMLSSQKLMSFKPLNITNYDGEPEKRKVKLDDVRGSTVEAYQADNLFEALTSSMNDKNIAGFMAYIMKSGGIRNPGNVFKGVCFYQEEDGNIFVSEGNHRVLTYQMLKKIREFVTGETLDGIEVDGTVQKVKRREWDFTDR